MGLSKKSVSSNLIWNYQYEFMRYFIKNKLYSPSYPLNEWIPKQWSSISVNTIRWRANAELCNRWEQIIPQPSDHIQIKTKKRQLDIVCFLMWWMRNTIAQKKKKLVSNQAYRSMCLQKKTRDKGTC